MCELLEIECDLDGGKAAIRRGKGRKRALVSVDIAGDTALHLFENSVFISFSYMHI
jgi:hypothetical protein